MTDSDGGQTPATGRESRLHVSPRHRAMLEALIRERLPGIEVWAYGSRVNGLAHDGSDLDLALRGPGLKKIPAESLENFTEAVHDSTIPFLVEARDWARLPERFHREIEKEYVVLVGAERMEKNWRETVYGIFALNFSADNLENLCSESDGIQTGPFGSQLHKKDYVRFGTPIITVEHLGENRILHHANTPKVSEYDKHRLAKYSLRKGDIVFSRVGSVDRRAIVRQAEEGWLFSGRCLRIRPNPHKIDPLYLSYFFGLPSFQEYIRAIAVGATMPSLNTQLLSNVTVLYPHSLSEQRAIAHILGTLDDKIELNRRMNETLEEMARALFKYWFVDFGPVRAKMESRWRRGESLPGLPAELYDLFPDRLVESELGEVPEGWEVKALGDLCQKPQYGFTASAQVKPVGPKFLRITDINKDSWVSWSRVPYCMATHEEFSKYQLSKGDILIARMADPGHGIMVENELKAVFASYLIRFRPIESRTERFLQYWLRSDAYWQLARGRAAGTTRRSLNAKVLSQFPIIAPSTSVTVAFADVVDTWRSRLVKNVEETENFTALRNTLLPKLISGKIRIRKAEKSWRI